MNGHCGTTLLTLKTSLVFLFLCSAMLGFLHSEWEFQVGDEEEKSYDMKNNVL